MIYLYDEAIATDLRASFGTDTVVRVIETDLAIGLAAQLKRDDIQFPVVAVTRQSDTRIDIDRMNFTRAHRGVAAVLDTDTNELYYERVLPVNLNYSITILTTNTADRDELERELLFKYMDMYFLTIKLPYESNRKVRFGVALQTDTDIEHSSGTLEYLEDGQVYQSIIPLRCEGCVLVNYVPAKLRNTSYSAEPILPGS